MPAKVSVNNKKGRRMTIGSLKPGRRAIFDNFTSGKHRDIALNILTVYPDDIIYGFRHLAFEHMPSHRGARTSLSPRHR